MTRRAIVIDGFELHPLLPELVGLVHAAYGHFRRLWAARSLDVEYRQVEGVEYATAWQRDPGGRWALDVAVVGTNRARDWLYNLDPTPRRLPGIPGVWRGGFARAGEALYGDLQELLRPWSEAGAAPHPRIRLIGHSLGAALLGSVAAQAARDGLAEHIEGPVLLGSPRFCSRAAADYLERHYPGGQRILRGFDLVPSVVWGSVHAFPAVFVDSRGRLHRRRGFRRWWGEAWRALRRKGLQVLQDHSIAQHHAWAQTLPEPVELEGG